jgi:ribosome biogenesis protein ENP2
VKLWHENDGRPYASIEPDVPLNDLHFVDGTGLMMIACEQPKLFTYYLPSVGPAPRWCAFLDNITDELEETTSAVYDDYKFVTASELEALGLSKAIGTSLLRAYMHGYFVDARLYTKARQLSDPFAYEQYRQRRIQVCVCIQRIRRLYILLHAGATGR